MFRNAVFSDITLWTAGGNLSFKKAENIELHNCARFFSFGERIKRNPPESKNLSSQTFFS